MQNPYGGGPPPGYGPPGGYGPPQHPHPQQQAHLGYAQPPQGYAQPPAPQMQPAPPNGLPANGQWGPQGHHVQPRVVFGVPLEPGEKVLYFQTNSRMFTRVFQVIIGIPFILLFGLGIYLIYSSIVDRKDGIYAQAVTNKRVMAINGHGKLLWALRWEEVAGLNKVTGKRYEFGVRNAQGTKFMFTQNVEIAEMVLTKYAGKPMLREQAPEVQFDHNVN